MPAPGMLRQPLKTGVEATSEAININVDFVFLFSILPTFDTSNPKRSPREIIGSRHMSNSKKPAKSSQTIQFFTA
jgi:hypothetical protein